jgi:hypothetical protein
LARVISQAGFSTEAGQLDGRARCRIPIVRADSMIAKYTDHAANERTFLAWIRTGLAVAAFGLFLVKLNVLFDAIGAGTPILLRNMPRIRSDRGSLCRTGHGGDRNRHHRTKQRRL